MDELVSRFVTPDGPTDAARRLLRLAAEAGRRIEEVQARRTDDGIHVERKGDGSPVTAADLASHAVLAPGLADIAPDLPVLSEESHKKGEIAPATCWVVDPLDGTKEFIKRNGEYVVNIGLVEDGVPVFGLVHVPATGEAFVGAPGVGAWHVVDDEPGRLAAQASAMGPFTLVTSRSHRGPETDALVAALETGGLTVTDIAMGSAWKFLVVAQGRADCYPRLGPTMWWDTLAPQAVVEGAGCRVIGADGQRFRYTAPDLLNPWFAVLGPTGPLDEVVLPALKAALAARPLA